MEEDDANTQQGGGDAVGVWIIFQRRGAGGAALWIGGLGGHHPHRKGPGGGISVPGGETSDETAPVEETGQEVDVHLGGARTRSHSKLLHDHY